ncbi:MAG TPA: methylated-DNA--[protein]-cysteine S-methyltransferase [Cytophagaceae bacterium]|jgi:methylated-DNA-[protein]-cysteine S-methyltransferase
MSDSSSYFGSFNSPLGNINISASDTGITALQFIEQPTLSDEGNEIIEHCKRELNAYFSGILKDFSVPLDLKCSDFQQQVLAHVKTVQLGTTSSYLQVAKTLLMPTASRAIGLANSKNKILILIPCHRIIGSSGSLVGYAGGLERKQWLLAHEAKVCGITRRQLSLQF